MGKVVFAVGIRGVGKSSIIQGVLKKNPNIKVLNFGDEMLRICIEKGVAKDRDDLRKIPNDVYLKVKEETWNHLASQKTDLIIDTHVFVEHTGRYIPGLPLESVKKFKDLRGLFYIDVDNDTLRARSQKDKRRIREGMNDLQINNYRYANISALAYYSTSLNIPFYIVFNEDGKLDQAVKIFNDHLKDAFA